VLPDERDANGTPRFIHKLQTRFVGGCQNSRNTLIRKVTGTEKIRELRAQHGEGYVGFYFIDDAVLKASQKADIKLHPLELLFGAIEQADVIATVMLPADYWSNTKTSAEPLGKWRRRA
jgi:hypothetical protein